MAPRRLGDDELFRRLVLNALRHFSSYDVDGKSVVALDGRLLVTVDSGEVFELFIHEVCCRNIDALVGPQQDCVEEIEADNIEAATEQSHTNPPSTSGPAKAVLWEIVAMKNNPNTSVTKWDEEDLRATCTTIGIVKEEGVINPDGAVPNGAPSVAGWTTVLLTPECNDRGCVVEKDQVATRISGRQSRKVKKRCISKEISHKDSFSSSVSPRRVAFSGSTGRRHAERFTVVGAAGTTRNCGTDNRNRQRGRQKCMTNLVTLAKRRQQLYRSRLLGASAALTLPQHLRSHEFRCSKCPELSFESRRQYSQHRYIAHVPYQCWTCNMQLFGRAAFNEHNKTMHPGVSAHELMKHLICEHCSAVFKSQSYLDDHIATRHLGQVYECSVCAKRLGSAVTLRVHMREQHDSNRRTTCEACGAQFSRALLLLSHFRARHPELLTAEQRRYIANRLTCEQCGADFGSRGSLKQHIRMTHERRFEQHECVHCNRVYTCRRYLTNHIRVCHSR